SGASSVKVSYSLQNTTDTLDIQAIDPGPWANVEFGVLNGRYQQTDGLRFTFGDESVAPNTVAASPASTTTSINLNATTGIYIGAVVKWTKADNSASDYGVVKTISSNNITLAFAISTAPAAGDTVKVVEFSLTVDLLANGRVAQTETFHNLNVNPAANNYAPNIIGKIPTSGRGTGGSNLIRVDLSGAPDFTTHAPYLSATSTAASGAPTTGADGISSMALTDFNKLFNDSSLDTDDPATRGGIYAFKNIRGMLMIGMPGQTDQQVQADLLALCEDDKYKFAVLDPAGTGTVDDWHIIDASPSDVIAQRGNYDSEYGALYYPWVQIEDPNPSNPNVIDFVNLPPSGHMMGIYARSDINRGVHKAPANEVVAGVVAFSHHVDQGTQDILNPLGINALRDFRAENRGLRVWGARTVSSNQEWKYINIRRLFQYIEASIEYGTQWVVFEPNNELLWARVRQSVAAFLTDTWRTGALMGTKASEAFYVVCDRTTMTQSDIENGRLIVEIGIAPTFPAEFVIFRISQWTASAT
ncbi:MAG TPA: phage tail sheath C-terminal domain-containing protein, partial [Candidatus Baltobacteraceae bacterium]|nr:phage tail sheath C-terminal domain-containing protein [Candidatus Baltobacteraceae bacterium]